MAKENRAYIRGKSAEFVQNVVQMSQRKEEPASAEAPVVDVKKIEDITMRLKEKTADKRRDYWETKRKQYFRVATPNLSSARRKSNCNFNYDWLKAYESEPADLFLLVC